jgi:hypothetical protein
MEDNNKIKVTSGELGMDKGALTYWQEPKGISTKPRFGKKPFPRQILKAFMLLFLFTVGLFVLGRAEISISTIFYFMLTFSVLILMAFPLLLLLDRFGSKKLWIYKDAIVRSHGSHKEALYFENVDSLHMYKSHSEDTTTTLEFVLKTGRTFITALPDYINPAEFRDLLSELGKETNICYEIKAH